MQTADARRYLFLLWIGLVGIQVANQVTYAWLQGTAKDAKPQCTTDYLVRPNKLIGASVVFTVLFGMAEWLPSLGVAFGAGIDLVALLGPTVAGKPGQNQTLFDKMAAFVKASA